MEQKRRRRRDGEASSSSLYIVLTLAILVPIFSTIASLDGAKQSCRTDDRVPLDGMVVFLRPPKAAAAGYSLIARSGMGVPVLNGST